MTQLSVHLPDQSVAPTAQPGESPGEWPAETLLSLALGLTLWETVGRTLRFPFIPPFSAVVSAAWELMVRGEILRHLGASVLSLAVGYALAVAVGVPTGAAMGRYRKIEFALDPFLSAFLSSPSLVYAPVLFALFGIGRLSQVAIVFLFAVFVITANTMTGIRTADASLLAMACSFGASERQLFWRISLPGSLPMIMAGLRIGMARAVKGMISGEMLIALTGLGGLLRTYGGRFQSEKVLGILLFVIAVAWVATGCLQALGHHLAPWAD